MAYFKYCFIRFSLLYTIYLNHLIVYLLNRKDKSLHRYFESTELAIGFPNGVFFFILTSCLSLGIPTGFYLYTTGIRLVSLKKKPSSSTSAFKKTVQDSYFCLFVVIFRVTFIVILRIHVCVVVVVLLP